MILDRHDDVPGEVRRDQLSAVHQRCTQLGALRLPRRPHHDRGRRGRLLHQALRHLRPHDRPRLDHRRPGHLRPAAGALLPCRTRLRQRPERPLRQHHDYRHLRLRRLQQQKQPGHAHPAGVQRHRHGHHEPAQGGAPLARGRGPLLHRRRGALQLQQWPELRRAQQHAVHGEHQQRLLRAPVRFLHPPADFPANPPVRFDYTAQNVSHALWQPVPELKYGSVVQLVLQGTNIFAAENHPIHIHDFYILAEGFGNFNAATDTATFNLDDPPMRNTVAVPVNGWAVIRFVAADNQGVWLMHCHLDVHITWGLAMAFLVEDGVGSLQSLEAPPPDLPLC
jgi:hypothetical protein